MSFLPAPTKQYHDGKWEPKLLLGVFAGHEIRPGYTWQGEYLVWDLDELVGINVAHYVEPYPSLRSPHVTKRVEMLSGGVVFPLKASFDAIHATVEGRRKAAEERGDIERALDAPPFDISIPNEEDPTMPESGGECRSRCDSATS